MTDELSPRLHDALSFAFELHGRDARKGSSVPVMAHLVSVCAIVQQDGGSEDEAIAALLHDSLEDKPELVDEDLLRTRFGANVLHMIQVATDTPPGWRGGAKPPWRERKQGYIERIASESAESLRPTIADKIDNVRAILADLRRVGDELWTIFKAGKAEQFWYYSSCYRAYVRAGASPRLLGELRALLEELARVAKHPIELGPPSRLDTAPYPKPDRSAHKPNFTKTEETPELDLGWAEGVLGDGRPYRLECWATEQITSVTVFFSRLGLEDLDKPAVHRLLEREGLVRFTTPGKRFASGFEMDDDSGRPMWSVNVVIGDEDGTYAAIGPSLIRY